MFCGKCGNQIEDDAKFCGFCGEVMTQSSTPVMQEVSVSPVVGKVTQKKKNFGIRIASLLVLVAIFIGAFVFIVQTGKPEVVTKKYMTAALEFDYDKVSKYSAIDMNALLKRLFSISFLSESEMAEKLKEEFGTTNIKKIYEGQLKEATLKEFEREFGENYSIEVDITSRMNLSESEMNREIDSIKEMFENEFTDTVSDISVDDFLNTNKIKEMCYVFGEVSISGMGDTENNSFQLICVKIGSKWKVLGNPTDPLSSF